MEVFVEIVSFFAAFAARKAAFFMPFFSCCRDSGFFMSFIWLITPILLVCNRLPAVYLHEIYRAPNRGRDKNIHAKQEARIISIGICRRMSG